RFTLVTVGGEAVAILRAEPGQSAPAVDGLLPAVDSSGQRLLTGSVRERLANGAIRPPPSFRHDAEASSRSEASPSPVSRVACLLFQTALLITPLISSALKARRAV